MTVPGTSEFLRELFPRQSDELFVRVITASEDRFPENTYWFSTQELHASSFELRLTEKDREVYFSPNAYASRGRGTKDNVAPEIDCVWMESDDEAFDWRLITEAVPSIVVQSSPGHHHLYWLLADAATRTRVERINRGLCYKYLTRDRSGWDLSQLLRVPGYKNYKRAIVNTVIVVDWHPERRYSLDVFETVASKTDTDKLEESAIPGTLPKLQDVLARWSDKFSKGLTDALKVPAADRSRALWFLYNECQRIGMTREETFTLAASSVNNKFADDAYNAESSLWRDVLSAYHARETTDIRDIESALDSIRQSQQRSDKKRSLMANAIFAHLSQSGRLCYSERTNEAFFYRENVSIPITRSNYRYGHLMDLTYGINPASDEFPHVTARLRNLAIEYGLHVDLKSLSYYDVTRGYLYVTNFRGGIWRLDGERIDLVENGVDGGVFFRNDIDAEPYTPAFEASGLLDELIFSRANFDSTVLDVSVARFLVKSWFFALFLPELVETRPLLILEGSKGSGKSTAFRSFEWLIRGSSGTVTELPITSREFREVVRERNYVFFDGVDSLWPGLSNLLSTCSSGVKESVRVLYTNNTFATYNLRCFFGISTMDARFLRDDVADRSVILRVERLPVMVPESDLKRSVLQYRNELWGELLTMLNQTLHNLKMTDYRPTGVRVADFAKILSAVADVDGVDPTEMLQALRRQQSQAVTDRSSLWQVIDAWLSREGNEGRTVSLTTLYRELSNTSALVGMPLDREIRNARTLAFRVRSLLYEVADLAEVEITNKPDGTHYIFRRKADASHALDV